MPPHTLPIRTLLIPVSGVWAETPSLLSQTQGAGRGSKSSGFTLIELLVVVFIIAVASAVTVLSLRSTPNQQSLQNAQQVAALLDAARANARAQKVSLLWRCDETGFSVFSTTPSAAPVKHSNWQAGSAVCDPNQGVVGPEPITKAQVISVYSADALGKSGVDVNNAVQIATDGLGPFKLAAQ